MLQQLSNIVSSYLLEKKTDRTVIGELPENGSGECEITFSILRPIGEIVKVHILEDERSKETEKRYSDMLANGQLPMEGDGYCSSLCPGIPPGHFYTNTDI